MNSKLAAMAFILLALSATAFAGKPQKYRGKVVTAMGTYEGMIIVDLNGPNKETIPIETTITDVK